MTYHYTERNGRYQYGWKIGDQWWLGPFGGEVKGSYKVVGYQYVKGI